MELLLIPQEQHLQMVLIVLPIRAQVQPLREFQRIPLESLTLLPYKMIMDVLQSRMVLLLLLMDQAQTLPWEASQEIIQVP